MIGHIEKIACIINHTIIMMDGNFRTLTTGSCIFCQRLSVLKEEVQSRIQRH